MRHLVVSVSLLVGLAACTAAPSDDSASSSSEDELRALLPAEVLGDIQYGQPVTINYDGRSTYNAYRLDGRKDEAILATASSANGDAMLWILDSKYRNLAYNDNETTATKNSKASVKLPADGRYYIVVREKSYKPAAFNVFVLLLNGTRGNALTPVCPPDSEGCTTANRVPLDPCGEGSFHPPTIEIGGGTATVGCVPRSVNGAKVVPKLAFLDDAAGATLKTDNLHPVTATNARFIRQYRLYGAIQALTSFDCASYAEGSGASCYDLRQYALTGDSLAQTVFGRLTPYQGVPALDWSGAKLGVAWFGYSNGYELAFRTLSPTGLLPTTERNLGTVLESNNGSDYERSRVRTLWDPTTSTFAIVSNEGAANLTYLRVKEDGSVAEGVRRIGDTLTLTAAAGDFDAVNAGGVFYVAYERVVRERAQRVVKAITPGNPAADKEIVLDEVSLDQGDPRVSLATDGTRIFAATGTGRGAVYALGKDLAKQNQYDIDVAGGVRSPDLAWDDAAGSLSIAWLTADNRTRVLLHMAPR